jgi:hypothetical protein
VHSIADFRPDRVADDGSDRRADRCAYHEPYHRTDGRSYVDSDAGANTGADLADSQPDW